MGKVFVITLLAVFASLLFTALGFYLGLNNKAGQVSPSEKSPYIKYSIEELSKNKIDSGTFKVGIETQKEDAYTSFTFEFFFYPALDKKEKKITGQLNVPKNPIDSRKKYPLILMLRGYVDQSIYQTGDGTRRAGIFFAKNDFITVSPDFLGYSGSDPESANIFEARFQTYVTAIALLNSLGQVPNWDGKNIFIWAHSNGGQIALTLLAATSRNIPTVLWAPVTKPFPYSVLYYTDESLDGGRLIRSELSKLEKFHNAQLFSFTNYLSRLRAPIRISQGTDDEAVPNAWSDEFIAKLNDSEAGVEYFVCTGCDHNMQPLWNEVITGDLEFFSKKYNIKE